MQRSTSTRLHKSYEGPALKALAPEQAKEFLLCHAKLGDEGAKEILALVLPTDKAAQ
jgi:hypothetical protein